MNVAGLFAGIGGFEVGLAKAGHHTVLTCENDPAAAMVLQTRLGVRNHDDVRTLKALPRNVQLICAGFPCQDLSQAGMTAGISGLRSGLIGEVFRLLQSRRVPWLVLENVPFMLHLEGGRALALIVAELESLGYRWAYRIVNTLAFGLPQRRERVFLVASTEGDPADVLLCDEVVAPEPKTQLYGLGHGFYWTEGIRGLGWAVDGIPTLKNGSTIGIPSPPAILMPDGTIIKPDLRDAERLQGFPEEWTAPAQQVKRASFRWALVGNAVSVPVSAWLGKRLAKPGRYEKSRDHGPVRGVRWPKAARFDGTQRLEVSITSAPVWKPRPHLHEFLHHPGTSLSLKATAGFYARTQRSSLRFPAGFLNAVAAHLARMEATDGREKKPATRVRRANVAAIAAE